MRQRGDKLLGKAKREDFNCYWSAILLQNKSYVLTWELHIHVHMYILYVYAYPSYMHTCFKFDICIYSDLATYSTVP